MAAQMFKVSKDDFIHLLKDYKPEDDIGYIMTVQDTNSSTASQVLMLYKPIKGNLF